MPKSPAKRSTAKGKAPPAPASAKKKGNSNEAQDVANFLLSLKHGRSVSPEPNDPEPKKPKPTSTKKKKSAPKKKKAAPKKQQSKKKEQAKAKPQPKQKQAAKPAPEPPVDSGNSQQQPPQLPPNLLPAPVVLGTSPPPPVPPVQHISSNVSANSVDFNFEELLDGSKMVQMKDRDLVPDPLFVAMAQMKMCRLTQADRVGCYKSRDLGFVGMCCKHCGGQPGKYSSASKK